MYCTHTLICYELNYGWIIIIIIFLGWSNMQGVIEYFWAINEYLHKLLVSQNY